MSSTTTITGRRHRPSSAEQDQANQQRQHVFTRIAYIQNILVFLQPGIAADSTCEFSLRAKRLFSLRAVNSHFLETIEGRYLDHDLWRPLVALVQCRETTVSDSILFYQRVEIVDWIFNFSRNPSHVITLLLSKGWDPEDTIFIQRPETERLSIDPLPGGGRGTAETMMKEKDIQWVFPLTAAMHAPCLASVAAMAKAMRKPDRSDSLHIWVRETDLPGCTITVSAIHQALLDPEWALRAMLRLSDSHADVAAVGIAARQQLYGAIFSDTPSSRERQVRAWAEPRARDMLPQFLAQLALPWCSDVNAEVQIRGTGNFYNVLTVPDGRPRLSGLTLSLLLHPPAVVGVLLTFPGFAIYRDQEYRLPERALDLEMIDYDREVLFRDPPEVEGSVVKHSFEELKVTFMPHQLCLSLLRFHLLRRDVAKALEELQKAELIFRAHIQHELYSVPPDFIRDFYVSWRNVDYDRDLDFRSNFEGKASISHGQQLLERERVAFSATSLIGNNGESAFALNGAERVMQERSTRGAMSDSNEFLLLYHTGAIGVESMWMIFANPITVAAWAAPGQRNRAPRRLR